MEPFPEDIVFRTLLPNVLGEDDRSTSEFINELCRAFSRVGYSQEHQRMLNIDKVCGHNHFKSESTFCNVIIKEMKYFIRQPNNIEAARGLVGRVHRFIKDGWCSSCCIRITPHLPILKIGFIKQIKEYAVISILCNLYVNSMQYFAISKHYLFKQNHQILFIFELFLCLLNCEIMRIEQPEIYYQSLFCFGLQINRHLGLLKQKHWKQLFIKSELIETLISRIKIDLLSRNKSVNENIIQQIHSCLAVVCYLLLNLMQKYFEIEFNSNDKFKIMTIMTSFKNDLKGIRRKITRKMIRSYKRTDNPAAIWRIWIKKEQKFTNLHVVGIDIMSLKVIYEMICFANSLLCQSDPNEYTIMAQAYREENIVWKRENVECQYAKCRKIKKRCKQFFRCKKCNVFKYCSRKCAKKDWKRGTHRGLCNTYNI